MKLNKTVMSMGVLVMGVNMMAGEIDGGAVLGSALGAAAGSAIGSANGGKQGAIIGGGVGGALGAAVGSSQSSSRERVVYVNDRRGDYYRHDRGNHYGQYKHRHGHGHD